MSLEPFLTRYVLSRLSLAALLSLTIGVSLLAGCGDSAKTNAGDSDVPRVAAVKVVRKNLTSNLEIASEFEPFQEVDVYAKVSGYIQKLYVDWGTHVKQGDLLAVLEIPELEQQLRQDEAAVHKSEQDIARAREALAQAKSTYDVSHLNYSRLADVQKTQPGLLAQEEIDEAHGKDLEASAGVSGANDALGAAQQSLLESQAALAKDKAMYAYARITAPFNGTITEIYAYTGALLPAGTAASKGSALCRISQIDLLRLVIPVPEQAVPDVHQGQKIAVKVSALNKTIQGEIASVSGQIDTQTRTMHTEVHVENAKGELVPGMYASVELPLHEVQQVLTLPIQAVQEKDESHGTVLVVDSQDKLEQRNLNLGLRTATDIQIASGLNENEMVLFGEQAQYKPGERVQPQITTPPEIE
jgi:RND family efflux transporter MFP subunit